MNKKQRIIFENDNVKLRRLTCRHDKPKPEVSNEFRLSYQAFVAIPNDFGIEVVGGVIEVVRREF